MKRSYPYTGPGASSGPGASQQATSTAAIPGNPQAPDYSAYGYGANSAVMSAPTPTGGLSQEAQQAQWHQQWQQYYAQQAASGAAAQNRPPPPPQQQGPAPHHTYPYTQPPQQTPTNYQTQYGVQAPSQQASHTQNPAYQWSMQQQANNPKQQGLQTQGYNPMAPGSTVPQGNFFPPQNQGNAGPPAKRQRYDTQNQQQMSPRPGGTMSPAGGQMGNMQFSPLPNAIGPQVGPMAGTSANPNGYNANWQNGSHSQGPGPGPNAMRTGPMRGGHGPLPSAPHMSGPSNMAGPMAGGASGMRIPSTPMADRRGGNMQPGRPHHRPQGVPNRPLNSSIPPSQGKFNGPVGVNALVPQSRPGISGRGPNGSPAGPAAQGPRRPMVGMRNGIPSGPSGKGPRADTNKAKGGGGSQGKAATGKGAGGFELHKAPAVNGKGSTMADQPVPASAKRTFSDFNIVGIQIEPIGWHWLLPNSDAVDLEAEDSAKDDETMQSITDAASVDDSAEVSSAAKVTKQKNKDRSEGSKEMSRLRICFAASQPPPGAPTGPKALERADATVGKEKDTATVQEADKERSPFSEPEWTAFSRGPPQSSTNRISISYASSRRRLVIDADVVKSVELDRGKRTMTITVSITTAAGVKKRKQMEKRKGEEWVVVKGVLLEAREADANNFSAVSRKELEDAWRLGSVAEVAGGMTETSGGEAGTTYASETGVVIAADRDAEGQEEKGTEGAEENQKESKKAEDDGAKGDTEAEDDGAQGGEDSDEDEDVGEGNLQVNTPRDHTSLPPFYRLLEGHGGPAGETIDAAAGKSEMVITVALVEVSPKQEIRWVKTGDVDEWLSALPGFQTSHSLPSLTHPWTDKIHVVDPDPPPTIHDVFQDWMTKSFVCSPVERKRFLDDQQLHTSRGITDLMCKLIRGDRATPTPSMRDLGEPLKEALAATSFTQSHLTLGVVAIVKLLQGYASLAGVVEESVEEKLQEIFMCLPTHQIFRACDGLLKEVTEKNRLAALAGRSRGAVAASASALPNLPSRDGTPRNEEGKEESTKSEVQKEDESKERVDKEEVDKEEDTVKEMVGDGGNEIKAEGAGHATGIEDYSSDVGEGKEENSVKDGPPYEASMVESALKEELEGDEPAVKAEHEAPLAASDAEPEISARDDAAAV